MRHLAYVLALIATLGGPALAAEPKERIVGVSGTGEVQAQPDLATLGVGVVTNGDTAKAALAANGPAMEKVIGAVREAGVASRDLQTSGVAITPIYSRQTQPDDPPRISGYAVSKSVTVRLRDTSKLSTLLDALVSAGANRMYGPSFSIAEPEKLRDEARRKAVADARRKAELYAAAAGVKLGRVVSIEENEAVVMPRFREAMAAAPAARSNAPVETGELDIRATVRVIYALE
jgi:hypothetical protein